MTRPLSDHNLEKLAQISIILAAVACIVFWLVRIYCAISFTTPYLLVTTGCEEETMFSIWKFVHGQVVYADPDHIPFAVSCYNWGFYYFYGSISKFWLNLLHLDAVWIPTIGRLISLIFTLMAGGIFYLALRDLGKDRWFSCLPRSCAWSLIVAVGPLVGFWSMSLRPDIGALMFESAGLYSILCYLRTKNFLLIIVAALLFYAGWSFKQPTVTMLTGSAVTLLFLKDWRALITLCGIWWFLVILTFVLGGATYRECTLFSMRHVPLLPSLGIENALRAECKNEFFLPALLAIIYFAFRRFRALASNPVEIALLFVVLWSVFFALITSCKVGANDNYYMPAAWAVMLGLGLSMERHGSRLIMASLVVCSWIMIAGIALSPTGYTYYYDYRSTDPVHRIVADKLAHLPGPAFVTERYANLPWMQSHPPYFVVGYAYDYDRQAGVPCERGGWEGLLNDGYFGSVVIRQDYPVPLSLLQKYELVDEYKDQYNDYKFYRRKP